MAMEDSSDRLIHERSVKESNEVNLALSRLQSKFSIEDGYIQALKKCIKRIRDGTLEEIPQEPIDKLFASPHSSFVSSISYAVNAPSETFAVFAYEIRTILSESKEDIPVSISCYHCESGQIFSRHVAVPVFSDALKERMYDTGINRSERSNSRFLAFDEALREMLRWTTNFSKHCGSTILMASGGPEDSQKMLENSHVFEEFREDIITTNVEAVLSNVDGNEYIQRESAFMDLCWSYIYYFEVEVGKLSKESSLPDGFIGLSNSLLNTREYSKERYDLVLFFTVAKYLGDPGYTAMHVFKLLTHMSGMKKDQLLKKICYMLQ